MCIFFVLCLRCEGGGGEKCVMFSNYDVTYCESFPKVLFMYNCLFSHCVTVCLLGPKCVC